MTRKFAGDGLLYLFQGVVIFWTAVLVSLSCVNNWYLSLNKCSRFPSSRVSTGRHPQLAEQVIRALNLPVYFG